MEVEAVRDRLQEEILPLGKKSAQEQREEELEATATRPDAEGIPKRLQSNLKEVWSLPQGPRIRRKRR